jgi:hypothetical protein
MCADMVLLRPQHRLVIVSGKGGVGKSLLAAALAHAAAAAGLRCVLVTADNRDDVHPLLGAPLRYPPRESGFAFSLCRIDPFQAAAEYARRSLPMGRVYEGFFKTRAFRDVAAAAPGFEALMSLGRLYNLAVQSDFDRVIFDAPATGHLRELLAVPAAIQRAVRVGPLNLNARKIEDLLLDPDRTRVLVATLAEEMAVREALELISACRDGLRMGVGPVLINGLVPRRCSAAELARLADLDAAGKLAGAARRAWTLARLRSAEADAQQAALQPLAAARLSTVAVPRIVQAAFDPAALLDEVARHLQSPANPVGFA